MILESLLNAPYKVCFFIPIWNAEEVSSNRGNCAGRTIERIGSWMNPMRDPSLLITDEGSRRP